MLPPLRGLARLKPMPPQSVFSAAEPQRASFAAMHAHREAVTNKEGMAAAAERLNLPPFLQLHAGQTQGLSAGMKVRVYFARAHSHMPAVLFPCHMRLGEVVDAQLRPVACRSTIRHLLFLDHAFILSPQQRRRQPARMSHERHCEVCWHP